MVQKMDVILKSNGRTLPHPSRGIIGSIFSNRPKECSFVISDPVKREFWNSIVLIDFTFSVVEGQLIGSVHLAGLKNIVVGKLIFEKKPARIER